MNRLIKITGTIALVAIAVAALLFPFASPPARGQVTTSGLPIVPLGYCQLTSIDAATAISTCSGGIPAGATLAIVKVETQAIRWRDDGTNPTAAVGFPMATADPPFLYFGTLTKLVVISQVAGAKLDVAFYR